MLSPIGSFNAAGAMPPAITPARIERNNRPEFTAKTSELGGAHQFGSLFTKLIDEVDSTRQAAAAETQKVMLGQTDQIHNAMISLQESSLALGLMVEVRNKLVESYQELMRMPV
jgi:flagellar hook-basal body complex protein FliE